MRGGRGTSCAAQMWLPPQEIRSRRSRSSTGQRAGTAADCIGHMARAAEQRIDADDREPDREDSRDAEDAPLGVSRTRVIPASGAKAAVTTRSPPRPRRRGSSRRGGAEADRRGPGDACCRRRGECRREQERLDLVRDDVEAPAPSGCGPIAASALTSGHPASTTRERRQEAGGRRNEQPWPEREQQRAYARDDGEGS